jgi:flagellar basal body rod protein FlgC
MIGAISNAVSGLISSAKRADNAAQKIVAPNADITKDMIDLKSAEISYKSNAVVIKTAVEMSDALNHMFDEKV